MGNHAGQNIEDLPLVFCPSLAYIFSKPLNWLEFDPSYPQNPKTLGDYIRKWRMDKGISQVEFAKAMGVNEMTVVNWEIRGMVPAKRHMERLTQEVEGVERFLP